VLELGEELLDRIEIGRVLGQEEELGTGSPDGVAYGAAFVGAVIVDDDDVARLERGREDLLDVLQEALAIDRAVDEPRRRDPIMAQGGQEGHGLPAAVWCFAEQPLAAGRPSAKRRLAELRRRDRHRLSQEVISKVPHTASHLCLEVDLVSDRPSATFDTDPYDSGSHLSQDL
jgi:hypothetical protein